MKKLTFIAEGIGLFLAAFAGCAGPNSQGRYWHDRLLAVDRDWMWSTARNGSGWFHDHGIGDDTATSIDSAIWAISQDTNAVIEIENSAHFHERPKTETATLTKYTLTNSESKAYAHDPRYFDSLQAERMILEDSANLRVDELALNAMNGDIEAIRRLAVLRHREGDTNGMLTRDELKRRIIQRAWEIERLRRQYLYQ